jgi:hypothetical protein
MAVGNTTVNTDPAIRAVVHSDLLLKQLEEGFLPEGLVRDVTDFGDGDLLQIPTLGQMALYDLDEGQDTPVSALDAGTVTLTITEHKGVAGTVSDELKEDAYKASAVEAEIVPQALRSIKEAYETSLLAQINKQTLGDENAINNVAHRVIASGVNNTLDLDDLAYLKMAFDEVSAPEERVLILPAIAEMTLNSKVGAQAFNNNPQFLGVVGEGFAKGRKFLTNIFGFDIWVSTRLPRIASESITYSSGIVAPPVGSGAQSITNGIAAVAMVVADDMSKPFMGAWRRMPRVEGFRNVSKRRDEFHVTARYGFGVQRFETCASLLLSANNYK